jgi:hypothetical protein
MSEGARGENAKVCVIIYEITKKIYGYYAYENADGAVKGLHSNFLARVIIDTKFITL